MKKLLIQFIPLACFVCLFTGCAALTRTTTDVGLGAGGAAIGGVGGALAGVLLSRNQNVILRPGANLEMVLDRDLVFHPEELP